MTAPGLEFQRSFLAASTLISPESGPKLVSFRSCAAQTVWTMMVVRLLPVLVTARSAEPLMICDSDNAHARGLRGQHGERAALAASRDVHAALGSATCLSRPRREAARAA